MGGEFSRRGPTRWQMPPRAASLAVFAALLLLVLVCPPRASAGTYDVYSCRLPDNTRTTAHGWRPFDNLDPGEVASYPSPNDCTKTSVGKLVAGFYGNSLGT